jgi:hypothetical protein
MTWRGTSLQPHELLRIIAPSELLSADKPDFFSHQWI